jgi:hypothetical protein
MSKNIRKSEQNRKSKAMKGKKFQRNNSKIFPTTEG